MKIPKKKSKRETLGHKHKIERKVREHKRKVRKEAKKNPNKYRSSKKDPGIPNLWPYKEQMLEHIQRRNERAEQQAKRRTEHLRRLQQQERAKVQSIAEMAADAQQRGQAYDLKEQTLQHAKAGSFESLNDNSKRAYFREFRKVMEAADVILEVLDARDPIGCRCKAIEQYMLAKDPTKKIVLILNKIDLVPREVVQKWLVYLRNEYPTLAFKCATTNQRSNIGQSAVPATEATEQQLNSSQCLGAGSLMQLLKNYSRNNKMKSAISVGIIGYPNVGKSSLINSMSRARVATVGAAPGETKTMQEVQMDKKVRLLDCPGIVFAAGEDESGSIILRNCVNIGQLDDPIKPIDAILQRCRSNQLLALYKIPSFETTHDFLALVARKQGKLQKGGIPDYEAAARVVLHDWNSGRIKYYTVPPEAPNVQMESAVVQQLGAEFDLAGLLAEQDAMLSTLTSLECTPADEFMELASREAGNDASFIVPDAELEDSSMMVDEDEDEDVMVDAAPTRQRLRSEEDEFNPQANLAQKKKFKQMQKKKRKEAAAGPSSASDDFDFSTDFVADNDYEMEEDDDIDDEELLDL